MPSLCEGEKCSQVLRCKLWQKIKSLFTFSVFVLKVYRYKQTFQIVLGFLNYDTVVPRLTKLIRSSEITVE